MNTLSLLRIRISYMAHILQNFVCSTRIKQPNTLEQPLHTCTQHVAHPVSLLPCHSILTGSIYTLIYGTETLVELVTTRNDMKICKFSATVQCVPALYSLALHISAFKHFELAIATTKILHTCGAPYCSHLCSSRHTSHLTPVTAASPLLTSSTPVFTCAPLFLL